MLKKIYGFIDNHISNNFLLHFISFFVWWVVFCFIFLLAIVDFTPATTLDYAPLISQQEKIEKDFSAIYDYNNYTISPKGNNISVILSNEQCSLICSFEKNLRFINYEKVDKAMSKIEAITLSIFGGFPVGGGLSLIITMLIPWILSAILKFVEKICRLLV